MKEFIKKFNTHEDYEEYITGDSVVLPNVSYCVDAKDVHYNHEDPTNKHAYVNLELPSGTLWATMNVGANSETDYGLYFAWGETQGYTGATQEKQFTINDYKFYDGHSMTKYNSSDDIAYLEEIDDAASVNFKGEWRIPAGSNFQELISNTTNTWVENYKNSGVNGMLFTSNSNGNTLFFPACGFCGNGGTSAVGNAACYWANSWIGSDQDYANQFYGENELAPQCDTYYRYHGICVRGIIGEW